MLSHRCCGQAMCQQQVRESQRVPGEEKATPTRAAAAREEPQGKGSHFSNSGLQGGKQKPNWAALSLRWHIPATVQVEPRDLQACRDRRGLTGEPRHHSCVLGEPQLVSHPSAALLQDTFAFRVLPSPWLISQLLLPFQLFSASLSPL